MVVCCVAFVVSVGYDCIVHVVLLSVTGAVVLVVVRVVSEPWALGL